MKSKQPAPRLAAVAAVMLAAGVLAQQASATSGWVHVPEVIQSSAALDGACSPEEYSNGVAAPALIQLDGASIVDVYVMHDADAFWLCVPSAPGSTAPLDVHVDPGSGLRGPDEGDFRVRVPHPDESSSKRPSPWAAHWEEGEWRGSDPGGWAAATLLAADGSTWSAEVRISGSVLQPTWDSVAGWNGSIGLLLELEDGLTAWPSPGHGWGEAELTREALLAFTPSVDLGYVDRGGQSASPLYFRSLGTAASTPWTMTWTISGTNAADFHFDATKLNSWWYGVVVNWSCCSSWQEFGDIVFTPTTHGPSTATLTFWTTADNSPHTVRLYGWGTCWPHCP